MQARFVLHLPVLKRATASTFVKCVESGMKATLLMLRAIATLLQGLSLPVKRAVMTCMPVIAVTFTERISPKR